MGIMAVEMEAAGALHAPPPTLGKRALAICSISDNLITAVRSSLADERQTNFTNMNEDRSGDRREDGAKAEYPANLHKFSADTYTVKAAKKCLTARL